MSGIILVQVELLALAVDRAAPGEEEPRHAGLLGDLRQADRGVAVDVEGELGVQLAHRVVGDRRQMHDAVATVQVPGVDLADVLDQLTVGLDEGLPVAALEEVEVAADDGVAFLLEDVDQVGPDVTAMACGENFHGLSLPGSVESWMERLGIDGWTQVGRLAGAAEVSGRRGSAGEALTAALSLGASPGFRPP